MSMLEVHADREMYNQLNVLRKEFDQAILQGDNFETVKKLYLHIKELERQLEAHLRQP